MLKKIFRVRRFVGRVYERYYPNPYLYTHTRPDGDIGLAARDVLKRYRYASPYYYSSSLLFSMLACCSGGGCGGWAGPDRAAVTIPINSIMDILNKFAVCFKVFPRGFSRLLFISVLSCG